jgi:nitroreductase
MNHEYIEKIQPILARRSIRKYTDQKVSETQVEAILQAAMAAPATHAMDPWRFVVVRDKKMLIRMKEGLPYAPFLDKAALGIVVCGDMEAVQGNLLGYLLQDCSAAIMNILHASEALDLGACWLGVHPREDRESHIRDLLLLPETIIPVSVISIGVPAEQKEPRTRYKAESVHYEIW